MKKSKWILRNGRKNPHQYHIIGDRGREPFHLSPLFVGRFYFFKYFSFIADRGRCGRVCFGALLSFVVCKCASLLFNFVVSTFETRVSTSLNVIALLCNISTV